MSSVLRMILFLITFKGGSPFFSSIWGMFSVSVGKLPALEFSSDVVDFASGLFPFWLSWEVSWTAGIEGPPRKSPKLSSVSLVPVA
jgi:hypothetical protein